LPSAARRPGGDRGDTGDGAAVVLGAAAVPLTYFPILIVANDARLMGERVNRRWANAAGSFFMLIMVVVSLASLPLLLLTKAGQ
jgi:Mn2+/Fe2+ NRAMP family transporter